MSLQLGTSPIKSVYLGSTKIKEAYLGGTKVLSSDDPYNPLGLPPFTIRCKFNSGYTPTMGDTQTLVDAGENVWDIYKAGSDWSYLFNGVADLLEVVGANATGVTNMGGMFYECTGLMYTPVALFDTSGVTTVGSMFEGCSNLGSVPLFNTSSATSMRFMFGYCSNLSSVPLFDTSSATDMAGMFASCYTLASVPLFDTSSATDMAGMFNSCSSLTTVPLFDTSSVTSMNGMFSGCSSLTAVPLLDTGSVTSMDNTFADCAYVQSGALALYQQASGQATPPSIYSDCFTNCGSATTTGAAELAQIPSSWGGTGA